MMIGNDFWQRIKVDDLTRVTLDALLACHLLNKARRTRDIFWLTWTIERLQADFGHQIHSVSTAPKNEP